MAWFSKVPVEQWRDHAKSDRTLANELYAAFVQGTLDAFADTPDLLAWDRKVGTMLARLERKPRFEWTHMASDERSVRRWCWSPGWVQMEQDEDRGFALVYQLVPLVWMMVLVALAIQSAHRIPMRRALLPTISVILTVATLAAVFIR